MIITKSKPETEIFAMLGGAKRIALVGCGSCATVCGTGGEEQLARMRAALEAQGRQVVAAALPDYCCMNLTVRTALKPVIAAKPDAVLAMTCGDGAQVVAKYMNCPTYPANDTVFLGEALRLGQFEEACRMCGHCVLGQTGGICPVTKCAKSLVNGPCGGARDGFCEVNTDRKCAWVEIYERMKALGLEDRFLCDPADPNRSENLHPQTLTLRREKP